MSKQDKLRAYLQDQRIVRLESRSGDGRNWDVSYDAESEPTNEQVERIIEICAGAEGE